MRKTKICAILIVGLLLITPDAFAFVKGDDQDSGELNMIEDMLHKKTYHDMVEERRRKSRAAIQARKKRKATLTPFVHEIPQEFSNLSQREENTEKKNLSKEPPPLVEKADLRKEISESLFANFLVITACFVGVIVMSKYLRPKK